MSALGLTIDFGPYGFIEHFNPKFIPNHSDKEGRYSYENQPSICKWNLMKLAEALDPLLPFDKSSEFVKKNFDEFYSSKYLDIMAKKLGFILKDNKTKTQLSDDEFSCIEKVFTTMTDTYSDFTNTFRALSLISKS